MLQFFFYKITLLDFYKNVYDRSDASENVLARNAVKKSTVKLTLSYKLTFMLL